MDFAIFVTGFVLGVIAGAIGWYYWGTALKNDAQKIRSKL